MTAYAAQRAGTLSGGQQQRAAIARAIVQQARLLLADEPIASLDPESARLVMDGLRRMNREESVTVLVSLHQIDYALRYCDRVIAMKDGRLACDVPAAELDERRLQAIYGAGYTQWSVDAPANAQANALANALAKPSSGDAADAMRNPPDDAAGAEARAGI
jgi:ABC-type phosphate/phosphonate transport system ATPase subunit